LHHDAQQQHDHEECGAANGDDGAHRARNQHFGRQDAHAPAGFVDAEEAPEIACHRVAEIGAKRKIAPHETVAFVPVRCRERVAVGRHQVNDFGAGLLRNILQQLVGVVLGCGVL
nr:hypothetical protein [Tanacetum cinerariifolium]